MSNFRLIREWMKLARWQCMDAFAILSDLLEEKGFDMERWKAWRQRASNQWQLRVFNDYTAEGMAQKQKLWRKCSRIFTAVNQYCDMRRRQERIRLYGDDDIPF